MNCTVFMTVSSYPGSRTELFLLRYPLEAPGISIATTDDNTAESQYTSYYRIMEPPMNNFGGFFRYQTVSVVLEDDEGD